MTIKELIIAQCKVQGVSEKYAERIEKASGITEEKDGNIIAAVKNFKENILPIIEEEKKEAVEEEKKKTPKTEDKTVIDPTKVDLPKDIDPSIKALIENQNKMIENLTKSVTTIVDSQKKSSTIETAKAKLKGKMDDKFIEKYAKRVNVEAENLDAEIENIVKEFNEDKQAFLNEAVSSGSYQPIEGGAVGDKSVEEWTKIMEGGDDKNKPSGVVDLGL